MRSKETTQGAVIRSLVITALVCVAAIALGFAAGASPRRLPWAAWGDGR